VAARALAERRGSRDTRGALSAGAIIRCPFGRGGSGRFHQEDMMFLAGLETGSDWSYQ
jgi:hypothetical protein